MSDERRTAHDNRNSGYKPSIIIKDDDAISFAHLGGIHFVFDERGMLLVKWQFVSIGLSYISSTANLKHIPCDASYEPEKLGA